MKIHRNGAVPRALLASQERIVTDYNSHPTTIQTLDGEEKAFWAGLGWSWPGLSLELIDQLAGNGWWGRISSHE